MLRFMYEREMLLSQKGEFIMIKKFSIEPGQTPTKEQLLEVEEAKKSPIVFDKDCEEVSPSMAKAFRSAAVQRNRRRHNA